MHSDQDTTDRLPSGASNSRLIPRSAAVTLVVLWAGVAHGAWEFVPTLSLEAETNDNPRLLPESPQIELLSGDPASRLLLDARALFVNYGARGEFSVEPAVRTDTYTEPENDDLQSTDIFLRTATEYRWQRTRTGFNADLSSEKILGSEYLSVGDLDPGADDLTVIDTVLLAENERRDRLLFVPFVEFESGVNGTWRFDSRYMDVRYDGDDVLSQRTDFRDLSLGTTYAHRLDDRNTVSGRLFVETFEADERQNTTNTAGIEARFSRSISEIWSLNVALGGVRSTVNLVDDLDTGPASERSYDNMIFSLRLRRLAELSRVMFDLQRDVNPDSFGFLVARNQLRFVVSQDFTSTVEGQISVRAIETESINDELSEGRTYGRLDLGVAWAFGELWSLTANYAFSSRDVSSSTFENGDASSNSVSIGLNYRGREPPR
jgi:hypothetical protein